MENEIREIHELECLKCGQLDELFNGHCFFCSQDVYEVMSQLYDGDYENDY